MSKSREWKDKRQKAVQDRMGYVRSRISEIGGVILEENGISVIFRRGTLVITYWPFTGGYSGKGIISGKGINNLVKYLKTSKIPSHKVN